LSLVRGWSMVVALPGANSPVARRLASGGFWSLIGDVGSRAFAFAGAIVVARTLGVEDYGAFVLIQSTVGMLMTFAMFGMGHTSTRYIAAYRNTERGRIEGIAGLTLWFAVLSGLLAAAALFAAAPYVATSFLKAPEVSAPLQWMAPVLTFCAVSSAMNGIILGFEAFQPMACLTWLTGLLGFIVVITGASIWGLYGTVLGLVTGEALRCAFLTRLAGRVMHASGFRLFGPADLSEAKILWRFTLPLLIGSALHAPIMWICQATIARQVDGMIEIGLYDAAQKWMTIVILAPFAASAAFGPVLASLSGGVDLLLFKRTISNLAVVQFVLTTIPAVVVALEAPWAAHIFGQSFAAAARVLPVMMALAPIFVLKHLYWQALTGAGHAWPALWLAILWAGVAVALTWSWREGGAMALAEAMLCAYGVTLAASVFLMERIWRR